LTTKQTVIFQDVG